MAKSATTKTALVTLTEKDAPASSSAAEAPKQRRPRRSPEDKIAALQAEIEATKARQAAREAKRRPEVVALVAAAKALDKAAQLALDAGDRPLHRAIEASRSALDEQIAFTGVRVQRRAGAV